MGIRADHSPSDRIYYVQRNRPLRSMNPPTLGIARHVSRVRTQRLVAQGRLLIAASAAVAAAVGVLQRGDGTMPLVVLGAWAALAAVVLWRAELRSLWIIAAVDVIVVAAIVLTTGGVASPFFPILVMPPFMANLLYGRQAMIVTAACGMAVYIVGLLVTHEAADTRMIIMRLAIVMLLAI